MKRLLNGKILSCIFLVLASSVEAVTFLDQAERLQLVYAHLLDFRPTIAPIIPKKAPWQVGADALVVPVVDNQVGNKDEKISPPGLILRPRGRYFDKSGLFAGASWIPPVEIQNYSANLGSLEIGYQYGFKAFLFRGRGTYSAGSVEGPITDNSSDDKFSLVRTGADVSLGYNHQEKSAWIPYVGGGQGHINTELKIEVDGVTIDVNDHSYLYGFVGISFLYRDVYVVSLEQSQSESFLRHIALSLNYSF